MAAHAFVWRLVWQRVMEAGEVGVGVWLSCVRQSGSCEVLPVQRTWEFGRRANLYLQFWIFLANDSFYIIIVVVVNMSLIRGSDYSLLSL